MADRRARQAVECNFEINGDVDNCLRGHAPEVAERISASNQIVAFRNQLSRGYARIDYPTVWQAVQEARPVLREDVNKLLREAEAR